MAMNDSRPIMFLKGIGVASSQLLCSSHALATPQPMIEEFFTASRIPGGRIVSYPEGTPEMRVYRMTLQLVVSFPCIFIHHPWWLSWRRGVSATYELLMELKSLKPLSQVKVFWTAIQQSRITSSIEVQGRFEFGHLCQC